MPGKLTPFQQDLTRYRKKGKLEWFEPSLWAICVYRIGQWCRVRRNTLLRRVLIILHLPLYSIITLLTGIQLPRSAKIGGGLKIWHFGCVVVNPDVVIGENCSLRQGVTIGTRTGDHDVPILGDNVDIGAGAKILGSISIGDNVKIGANAVVIKDVPASHLAVGVPARIVPMKEMTT